MPILIKCKLIRLYPWLNLFRIYCHLSTGFSYTHTLYALFNLEPYILEWQVDAASRYLTVPDTGWDLSNG